MRLAGAQWPMATVRHHVVVAAPPARAWALLGDPARLAEWFPGITGCVVEGRRRTVTFANGIELPEDLVTVDQLQRRLQYSVSLPVLRHHLSTIDVLDVDGDRCCCVYGVDADPGVMALVIGGNARDGLLRAKSLLEEEA